MDAPDAADTTAPVPWGCYIYCVTLVLDIPGLSLQGLDGAGVYQIAFRDIGAIVHDCPPVPYSGESEQAQDWLLAHHNVIDTVWEQSGVVLPVTFDVIIKGDSGQHARDQVVAWLEENYESFRDKLDSLQGRVELAIQVNWDRASALQEIVSADGEIGQLQEELLGKPKGMAFLYQQKIEKLIRQKSEARAGEICNSYLQRIQALSVQTCVNNLKRLDSLEMLLNLSVLVDREKISEIGRVLGELEALQGIDVHFTGPWPPYSFAMTSQACERTDCIEGGEGMEGQKTGGDVVAAILRLAGKLESDGRLHEACELYFKVLNSSAGTKEGQTARKALMNIAYEYERKGLVHMALDLYEKLG